MESTAGIQPFRRKKSMTPPLIMCKELRMVLLGKNSSEISKVGNFILGRDAFDTEAPPPSVEQHSERAGGTVEERYITLINTPHLFHPQLTNTTLNNRVTECLSLGSPGPHVLLLVLQPDDFTETDRHRLNHILCSLSEDPHKYTLVVTTQKLQPDSSVDPAEENVSQKIITEFSNTHLQFSSECGRSDLMEMVVKMVVENEESRQREQTAKKKPEHKQSTKEKCSQRLNLVVCGSDGSVKSSISDLILGQRELRADSSSVCVRREAEVCGRLITLVELPALCSSQLSEEEVMRETLRCVSLCDPGVHAFLLVLPEGRLTDEDKGELEKIQNIFGTKFSNYTIVLITWCSQGKPLDQDSVSLVNTYGRTFHSISSKTEAEEVIQSVTNLLKENGGSLFTVVMYAAAQIEAHLKYKRENEDLKQKISTLKLSSSNQIQDRKQEPDELRIVLLGKTGVGKSASANTISGQTLFKEDFTSDSVTVMCQKESTKVDQRRVTVIDTPGLFDTNIPNEEVKKEIAKCITLAAPGPHVFLLVLSLGQRFTPEEKEAVKMIQDLFGEESSRYTMVLFTRGDDLQNKTIEEFIKTSNPYLKFLIGKCGNRFHVFNNKETRGRTQVTDLLQKIDSMVKVNGGSCYTNEMFQNVEKALREEQARILKEGEEKMEREKEELRAKHEAEMETLRKTMKEEQQKQDEERKIREREFREREEQIKRESAERERIEREKYNKIREEDEKRIEECIENINREKEENRKQWEKQREEYQRQQEQEEEKRRKKEEDWEKKQREEKEEFEKEKEEMIQKERASQQKLQHEYEQKAAEEEKRIIALEEKIKHSEQNKKKELQELQLDQRREWERMKQVEEERRKIQEKKWRKELESKEKEWERLQNHKQELYEQDRRIERVKREVGEKWRKQREEEEKKRIEDEANQKIKQMQKQMDLLSTELKEKEKEFKNEVENRLTRQRDIFHKLEEERAKYCREQEERNLAYIAEMHEKEKEKLIREIEQTARREAEEKFCIKLDQKVKEAKAEGYREGEQEGLRKGFREGEKEGRDKGFREGMRDGRDKGFREGMRDGCDKGFREGMRDGRDKGFREGMREGERKGAKAAEAQRTIAARSMDTTLNWLLNRFFP